jgi:GNAT superfamily N-acetyltransferase
MLRRADNISSRATVCEACGVSVSLTHENKDMLGGFAYICPACNSIVAISYKGQKFRPLTVLSVSWNESLKESALRVTRNLYFAECKDQKALLALCLMQLYAKREQSGFLYLREAHKSALCFDTESNKIVAFVVWSENHEAIARQLFVVAEERRKGIASDLLRFWVKKFADRLSNTFLAESPNHKSIGLLVKLAYAKRKGKKIVGTKCKFVDSGL